MRELYPETVALWGMCLSRKNATSTPTTNWPRNCKTPISAQRQPSVERKSSTCWYVISDDLQRKTRGNCATTRNPSDRTETCGLGETAVLRFPKRMQPAYQMKAVVLISSTPARKAAEVMAGKMRRLSG